MDYKSLTLKLNIMNPNGLDFKTSISASMAIKIASSQKDLGGKSQTDMIVCLSSHKEDKKRAAYERLDPLSQMIVGFVLTMDDFEGCLMDFDYTIENLKSASLAIKDISNL